MKGKTGKQNSWDKPLLNKHLGYKQWIVLTKLTPLEKTIHLKLHITICDLLPVVGEILICK